MRKITKEISIMLVDDDFDDRQIFSEAISEILEKFTLATFSGGEKIIQHLSADDNRGKLPDIIFLDINMPIIDGLETLDILRNELKLYKVPIAMYSTSSMESDIQKALAAGANIYIKKPNSFDNLKIALHKALNSNLQYTHNLNMSTFLLAIC